MTNKEMHQMMTVLIVEDDECIASLMADALEWEFDVHIHTLHDGGEAIRYVARHAVDLAVLDYQLPNANGIQIYDAMRQYDGTAHTPVLFVTANDNRPEFKKTNLTYIRKPFDLQEFLAVVGARLQMVGQCRIPAVS